MKDDDIRHLLHSTYKVEGVAPTVAQGALAHPPRGPRRKGLVTSLVAAAAVVVVGVPVGATVLLRTGVIGGPPSSTTHVFDLKMFSAVDGWAWAGGNKILHTNSGVEQWTVVPPPIGKNAIVEVAWVDAESARILATSAGALNDVEKTYTLTTWMTDNGGATWTEGHPFAVLLETAQDATTTSDLQFVDPLHGWFFDTQDATVGAPILILRTVDGGIDWSTISKTPAQGTSAPGALPVPCEKYGMSFLNSTTGWVAGGCVDAPAFFYVTHNGGATWAPQPIGCGENCYLDPPQFTSALDGYMGGQIGVPVLFTTVDGGRTWHDRASPPEFPLDFIDAANGFTMALTGNDNPSTILWLTTDGGAKWRQAPNGAIQGSGPVETSQLDFITTTTGWAVSLPVYSQPVPNPIPPQLWQTTDAGSTWTLITPTITSSR